MTKHGKARLMGGVLLSLVGFGAANASIADEPIVVKVMIINMFNPEAAPWIAALKPQREVRVPGLSKDFPGVRCTTTGVCQITIGMGHANAAASMMALIYSRQFDLRQTYFLIAGTAGIDPDHGTIGTVAWARYLVDTGIAHEIDAREMPAGWSDGYFGILTNRPGQKPQLDYRSEVFQLDEALLQKALQLSRRATLDDSADVVAYRKRYPRAPANTAPQVTQCDTAAGDTWWSGRRLGVHATNWTRVLTDGHGIYCTTQQEDNATLLALTRGAQSGLVDIHRVAVLRSGVDFDRPYAGQTVFDSMLKQRSIDGAIRIATSNLVHAGMPLVEDIVTNWAKWQMGVPAR